MYGSGTFAMMFLLLKISLLHIMHKQNSVLIEVNLKNNQYPSGKG